MTTQGGDDNWPRQGDVYWVDFDPARGSEQAGMRPAVVISIDALNRRSNTCVIAAITTADKSALRSCLELPAGSPTPERSFIMPNQVMTIDHARLHEWIGQLSVAQVNELKVRLRWVWGL